MHLTELEQVVHKGGTNRAGVSPLQARERLLGSKDLCLYVTRVPIFKACQAFSSTSALASRRILAVALVLFLSFPIVQSNLIADHGHLNTVQRQWH